MIWPPKGDLAAPLVGSTVRMEPIGRDHLEGLRAISGDEQIWEWIDRRVPGDPEAFTAWFEARLKASQAGEEWCYVTHSLDSGEPIGSSSYLAIRVPHDGLEVGWTWLEPSAWRSGANREAKLLMCDHAFDELGCMRVEFKTDSRNERSRAALTALGASFEGIFHKHMNTPIVGVRDSAYFAITDEQWPEIRARIAAGLTEYSPGVAT